MDATETVENGIPQDIAAEMEADEKAWAQEERQTPAAKAGRDAQGRFTSVEPEDGEADEADPTDAQHAGEETAAEADKGSTEAKPSDGQKPAQEEKQKPEDNGTKSQDETPTGQQNQSRWARENERKAKTWEGINQEKAQLKAEREQFQLEREQFEAQQRTVRTVEKDASGHTAADYATFANGAKERASKLMQQAMEAEAAGDFDKADSFNARAEREQELASKAEKAADALRSSSGPATVWARLATDMPEALKPNSPFNLELRKLVRTNPELLRDPIGPYRGAIQIGKKVLESTQAELTKFKAEALKVPEMTKQIAALSQEVKRLTALTSLQGDGAPLSRESAGGRRFEDMTMEEMERDIESTILER